MLLITGAICVAAELPLIQFSLKPNLCVLAQGEAQCRDELHLRWHSHTPQSLCLYQTDKRLPLRCWENERAGEHQLAVAVSHDVEFQLRDMSNEDVLVADSFEVVQDSGNYRRKRRNPWSFF